MNIWKAYIALEHMYGTEASLKEVFGRSLQYNSHKLMYLHLASIYEKETDSSVMLAFNAPEEVILFSVLQLCIRA